MLGEGEGSIESKLRDCELRIVLELANANVLGEVEGNALGEVEGAKLGKVEVDAL